MADGDRGQALPGYQRELPAVSLRQRLIRLPKLLRYLFAWEGRLCLAVAEAAMPEVFR